MIYLVLILQRFLSNCRKFGKILFLNLMNPCCAVLLGAFALLSVLFLQRFFHIPLRYKVCPADYWATDLDTGFEDFDNVTGVTGAPIIPNYVHFMRYGDRLRTVNFMDAVNILAAYRNQRPDKIFFHTNFEKFEGKYWETLMTIPGLKETIEFKYITPVSSIFNQALNSRYQLWHSSDILRINILRRFGGVFLDNDVYLVRSIDKFRKFEMALEYIDYKSFGTMTLIAHRDARFLKLWHDSYRNYYGHLWYYNAGEKPKIEILDSRPELVHNAVNEFGVLDLRTPLYTKHWPQWKEQYTIHTMVRHLASHETDNNLNLKYPVTFTHENIRQYNVTILDMVLDCCKELLL